MADVQIDLSVVLGTAHMPVHQLLRMGRGAVIELESRETDQFTLYANDIAIAEGDIVVDGDRIKLSLQKMLRRAPDKR